jgi:hypothetical protein
MTGDYVTLKEAARYKKKYNLKYKIFGKNQKSKTIPGVDIMDIPLRFVKDSGCTLVARAILKGYDEIYLVGFDLGGKDLYVQDHEKRNKSIWIKNWRHIAKELGLEKVTFVGKDHKPFIYSNESVDFYAKKYLNGVDHLKDSRINNIVDDSLLLSKNKLLIIGDDTDVKKEIKNKLEKWEGQVWSLPNTYLEYVDRIDAVGSNDKEETQKIYNYKMRNELDFTIYSLYNIFTEGIEENSITIFHEEREWEVGALLLLQAIYEKFEYVEIIGYSLGKNKLNRLNDQILAIQDEFNFKNVKFIGEKPKRL